MSEFYKLSHVINRYDYHIVWTPKYRLRILEEMIITAIQRRYRNAIGMVRLWEKRTAKYPNRPYTSDGKRTTEIIDIQNKGSIKRQDGDEDIQELSEVKEKTILGKSFLVKRLLCWYYRIGWGKDKAICKV